MDQDKAQALAYRDQAWAGLRVLLPEIQKLAEGDYSGSDRERKLVQVLAGVVAAEIQARTEDSRPE